VSRGTIPRGKLVATFVQGDCSGGGESGAPRYVDYVQGQDGAPFLVERSEAAQWLVITNSFVESNEIVFQAMRENRGRSLQEYRFPWDGRTAGKYSRAVAYGEPQGTRDRFRVPGVRAYVVCRLRRVDPVTGALLDESEAKGREPTALPGPATRAQGWGYDGKSFRPGDWVLVDGGGMAKRAQVLQATGDRYFVRYEQAPEGSGEWVEPSRVLGRFN
jgi:hypothetical protein